MVPIEGKIAQTQFLQMGGTFVRALAAKRASGELPEQYEYHEYPKMIRSNPREVEEIGEDIKGRPTRNVRTVWDEVIVNSEQEEENVLAGGKTDAQIEEERQGLILRGRALGMKIDSSWSIVRLRRELGEEMEKPESPADRMAAMERELATLRKMDEMQAELEALRAKLSGKAPSADEADELRQQLTELGVKVDGRWSIARLREELEKATG